MSDFDACPQCRLPVIPTASEWQKRQGVVCVCVERRSATIPRADATKPVHASEAQTRIPAQSVTLPYPPSANHFKVPSGRGNRFVLSDIARQWKYGAEHKIAEAHLIPLSGSVKLTLHVYRPRKSGDLDNTIKLIQDTLSYYAFADDEQVTEIHAYRHEDKDNPRVEVTVEEAGG